MLGRLTALTRLTAPALRRGIASTPTLFESHPDFGKQTKNVADADATIKDHITEMLKQSGEETPVFLFMKGEPSDPQCGFSNQVCRVLHLQGVKFNAFNVLSDADVREGVKAFAEWPTIPQLYINGEFVGGCDIVTDMHKSGDLDEMLRDAGAKE